MNVIKEIERITALELDNGIIGGVTNGSWHEKYKNSSWVYVGGMPYELTEGDIICVMSQWGEIEDINLVREKETNKSLGYAFIKYEDFRSTILAVDNFNGIKLLNRILRVDHVDKYKLPKEVRKKEEEFLEQNPDEVIDIGPGHAYKHKEMENSYSINQGIDLWSKAPTSSSSNIVSKKNDDNINSNEYANGDYNNYSDDKQNDGKIKKHKKDKHSKKHKHKHERKNENNENGDLTHHDKADRDRGDARKSHEEKNMSSNTDSIRSSRGIENDNERYERRGRDRDRSIDSRDRDRKRERSRAHSSRDSDSDSSDRNKGERNRRHSHEDVDDKRNATSSSPAALTSRVSASASDKPANKASSAVVFAAPPSGQVLSWRGTRDPAFQSLQQKAASIASSGSSGGGAGAAGAYKSRAERDVNPSSFGGMNRRR